MPENLYTLFPDPDDLLRLEPEELGDAVFEAAQTTMRDGMFEAGGLTIPLLSLGPTGYPARYIQRVEIAIAEALASLERAGLIVRDPDQPPWYRFTSQASNLKTRADVAAFRASRRDRELAAYQAEVARRAK